MDINDSLQDLLFSFSSIIRKIARKKSISFSNAIILLSISSRGIIISQLSNKLGIDKTTMTRNLARLESQNLIIIIKNKNDIRSKLIYTSKQGDTLVSFLNKEINKKLKSIFNQLSHDEYENTINSLSSLSWSFINE